MTFWMKGASFGMGSEVDIGTTLRPRERTPVLVVDIGVSREIGRVVCLRSRSGFQNVGT